MRTHEARRHLEPMEVGSGTDHSGCRVSAGRTAVTTVTVPHSPEEPDIYTLNRARMHGHAPTMQSLAATVGLSPTVGGQSPTTAGHLLVVDR